MSDAAETQDRSGKGGKPRALLLGLVLAAAGAAGGYFAAASGLLGTHSVETKDSRPKTSFVAIDPMIVSIARQGGVSQLRLKLALEVVAGRAGDVTEIMPRILDVLNSYLRALETIDIGDAATLVRLRAQMLRRVQIVTGTDAVKDLLIQEFVVN